MWFKIDYMYVQVWHIECLIVMFVNVSKLIDHIMLFFTFVLIGVYE